VDGQQVDKDCNGHFWPIPDQATRLKPQRVVSCLNCGASYTIGPNPDVDSRAVYKVISAERAVWLECPGKS
jgi:hypothetical protein